MPNALGVGLGTGIGGDLGIRECGVAGKARRYRQARTRFTYKFN